MPKKWILNFVEAKTPMRGRVTKFGGQPVWIDTPQWPLSRQTGKPMQFIGQVALEDDLGFATSARMATVL